MGPVVKLKQLLRVNGIYEIAATSMLNEIKLMIDINTPSLIAIGS